MRRRRKITLALTISTVLGLGIAGAPAAQAFTRGETCGTAFPPGTAAAATGCVATNVHDTFNWKEGLVSWHQGVPCYSNLRVQFDYVKLIRNGVEREVNTADATISIPCSGTPNRSTDWLTTCFSQAGTYYSIARYKFTLGTWNSGWITRRSNNWTPPTDCGF